MFVHSDTCGRKYCGGRVTHLAWSPNGRQILSSSSHSDTCVWDVVAVKLVSVLKLNKAKSSRDGKQLATNKGGVLQVWNVYENRQSHKYEHRGEYGCEEPGLTGIHDFAWSPNGSQIAFVLSNTVGIYDLASRTATVHYRIIDRTGFDFNWSPDGKYLAMADDCFVLILNTITKQAERGFRHPQPPALMHPDCVLFAKWSPDGSRLATASSNSEIRIWNVATQKMTHLFKHPFKGSARMPTDHPGYVQDLAWSPTGKQLAVSSIDSIRIFDTSTGKVDQSKKTVRAENLAWSPNGKQLAYSEQCNIHIINVEGFL